MVSKFSDLMAALVSTLEWYEALSHRNTVLPLQPGDSVSRCCVRERRKRAIMLESVFACDSVNQTRPSVSRAAIIESRGETLFSWTFPSPFRDPQALRTKLVSLTHVSSIFMTRYPSLRSYNILSAYCYLSTRFLSELADG